MVHQQQLKQALCKIASTSTSSAWKCSTSPPLHLFNPSYLAGDAINALSTKPSTQHQLVARQQYGPQTSFKDPLDSIRDAVRKEMERRYLLGTSSTSSACKVALLGGPGVGKGTWGGLLAQHLSIPHISTGDLVRKELMCNASSSSSASAPTEELMLHEQVKSAVSAGKLLPDRLILDLLLAQLRKNSDPSAGFVLDGFPRTIAQATMLEDAIGSIDLALNFHVDEDVLVAKCLGRRTCKHCGKDYNLSHVDLIRADQGRSGRSNVVGSKLRRIYLPARLPPPECASHLSVRADDSNEEAVRERLRLHACESKPLIQYYLSQQKLVDVDVGSGAEFVWSSLLNIVEGMEANSSTEAHA